jgi:hypothetical protein
VPGEDKPDCDICDGSAIGNPDGIIFINGDTVTCTEAQAAGNAGLISSDTCSTLRGAAFDACSCGVDDDDCDICDGSDIGNPTGIISVNGRMVTCIAAQATGSAGLISSDTCSAVQGAAFDACSCGDGGDGGDGGGICDICGPDLQIGNPNGIIVHDDNIITCAEAQELGDNEEISSIACLTLQSTNSDCNCVRFGKGKGKGKGKGRGKGKGVYYQPSKGSKVKNSKGSKGKNSKGSKGGKGKGKGSSFYQSGTKKVSGSRHS